MPVAESDQDGEGEKSSSSFSCRSAAASAAIREHDNPNVLNILPVTTLRTIDLEGKKNSDPLFSRFWVETRDFFEVNYAPECVQANFDVGGRGGRSATPQR